jgi:hypothetical protein
VDGDDRIGGLADGCRTHAKTSPAVLYELPQMEGGLPLPLPAYLGHPSTVRFHANDIGKARFDREPLKKDGADLLMERYDTSFRFVKVRH